MSGQEVLLTCQKVLDLERGPQSPPPAEELWAQPFCSHHRVYLLHSSAIVFLFVFKWLLNISLPPDIVDKVLLEHSHSHLFPNGL